MANLTGKHQDKIPGMGGYVNAGPDPQPKQPTRICTMPRVMYRIRTSIRAAWVAHLTATIMVWMTARSKQVAPVQQALGIPWAFSILEDYHGNTKRD